MTSIDPRSYDSSDPSAQASPHITHEVPLDQPLYGATFGQAWSRFWRKYANFTGRASLSEFWKAVLLTNAILLVLFIAVGIVSSQLAAASDSGAPLWVPAMIAGSLFSLFTLAVIVPGWAVGARRLHDTNRSGWWQLIMFVPFGAIVLLVFFASGSVHEGNRFDVA